MSIIRTAHNQENPYVMLNKTPLSDRNLSWAAKGLWSFLISKKDDWKVSVAHLSKIFIGKGGGRDAIYSLLDELIEQGYCERKGQSQNIKGQFSSFEYIIYEFKIISPLTGSPEADEPDTDLPDTAEPATTNKPFKTNNENTAKKETTTTSECVVPLDKEKEDKLNELKKVKLSHGLIESSMSHSLADIKLAIECCLSSLSQIKDMDAYYWSALTKKWQPKPNKEKITKQQEESERNEQQTRQKLYIEAKQLELVHSLKFTDDFKFTVTETAIIFKIGKGYTPYPINETSMKILKDYINKAYNRK